MLVLFTSETHEDAHLLRVTSAFSLRLDIVHGILRSSVPALDDDGEQADDEAGLPGVWSLDSCQN
jgi:hypothetical protein